MLRRFRRLMARQEAFDRVSGRAMKIIETYLSILSAFVIVTLALMMNPTLVIALALIALGLFLADLFSMVSAEPA